MGKSHCPLTELLVLFIQFTWVLGVVRSTKVLDAFECCKKFDSCAMALDEPLMFTVTFDGPLCADDSPRSDADCSQGGEARYDVPPRVGGRGVHDPGHEAQEWSFGGVVRREHCMVPCDRGYELAVRRSSSASQSAFST
jgi:hypothetical protein